MLSNSPLPVDAKQYTNNQPKPPLNLFTLLLNQVHIACLRNNEFLLRVSIPYYQPEEEDTKYGSQFSLSLSLSLSLRLYVSLLTPISYPNTTTTTWAFFNVKRLLRLGSETEKKDFNGDTAADVAQNRKRTEISIWLKHTRAFGNKGVYTYNDIKREKALKV